MAPFLRSTWTRTFAYWPGRSRLPGFGKAPASWIVPVFTSTSRPTRNALPRCGKTEPSERMSSSGPFSRLRLALRVFSGGPFLATHARYSCSLGLKYTLMGSTCETVVMTVWPLTRSPTCDLATPATPSIGETDLRPAEVELRLLEGRARAFHVGLRRALPRLGVVELLLADRLLRGQGSVARHGRLRVGERGLVLGERALGLVVRRLELPRVDLEEGVAGFDGEAFPVDLLEQVALDLRTDLGVDVAVERADPLLVDRDVLLGDGRHLHRGRRRRRRRLRLLAALAGEAVRTAARAAAARARGLGADTSREPCGPPLRLACGEYIYIATRTHPRTTG